MHDTPERYSTLLRYLVITFGANDDGSGGGLSRIMMGGGVLGGVGRSMSIDDTFEERN